MLGNKTEFRPLNQETIAGLQKAAEDPVDVMRLAADFYASNAYLAERALALEAGKPPPKPPKPISNYLRALALDIRARFLVMAPMFSSEELQRLRALGPRVEQELGDHDEMAEIVLSLLAMHPAVAAQWIRAHLGDLEVRFAS